MFDKQKKQIKELMEKSRDYDEQYPRKLRKYWVPFILGLVFADILLPLFGMIILLPLLIIIIVPAFILISLLRPSLKERSNDITDNLVDDDGMTELEKERMINSYVLIEGRSFLGKISGALIFIPIFIAPLTGNILESLTLTFPMLQDISFNLSFVNFNILHWIKTILNIVQFMVAFYITRRIRNIIRNKITSRIGRNNFGYSSNYVKKINKLCKSKKYRITS